MIVRGGAELDKLFETIEISGFMGRCNMEQLRLWHIMYPNATVSHNPRDWEGSLNEHGAVDRRDNLASWGTQRYPR